MNDRENERFERELHKLRPAKAPEELMARLAAAPPRPKMESEPACLMAPGAALRWRFFRWFIPAAAAATFVFVFAVAHLPHGSGTPNGQPAIASLASESKPDELEINRQLVASFDAVAQLPGGQPVRFNCREWREKVVFRDSARGLVIERSIPRLEVIPVRVETY